MTADSLTDHKSSLITYEEIERSLVARFAQQARAYTDKIAIRTVNDACTYAELDRLSNRIAHLVLRANPAIHGNPVLLAIDDEILLVAAIFGVLKSGGMYVPLDPYLPHQVAREIAADVGAPLVITDLERLEYIKALHIEALINLDADLNEGVPDDDPGVRIKPTDFAYIYYTSGSTGKPKGVFDNHRNVLHNVMRYTNNLQITHADRLTLVQSCGFSGAVSNIFCALLNGATLLPFDVKRRGGALLANWIHDAGATIYHSVPSLFRHLVRHDADLSNLRIVRLEGDRASLVDVELFRAHCPPSCVLAHGLGATETGLSCQYLIEHQTAISANAIPVGFATTDMRLDIVDDQGVPLPDGEIGEVVVRSAYLACGYWNQPGATKVAFNPSLDGDRCYFSGDLGRIEHGMLELCGRKDSRLKFDGHWIDTLLLESTLRDSTNVEDARVLPIESGGRVLVAAFLVAPKDLDRSSIRVRLEMAIGIANAPIAIIVIDQWPLNLNGKLDHGALIALVHQQESTFAPPKTPTERKVWTVFREAMAIDGPIGIDDDFYRLGGDSLTVVEIVTALTQLFDTQIPMAAFMRDPTVRGIARAIDDAVASDLLITLKSEGSLTPIFCVHAHMGHVFNLRELAQQLTDWPVYGIQARGFDGHDLPHGSIAIMASDYVARIREQIPRGPYIVAGYCFGGLVAVEMARELLAMDEELEQLILIDTECPAAFRQRPARTWRKKLHKLTSAISVLNALRYRLDRSMRRFRSRVLSPFWRYALPRNLYLPAFARRPSFAIDLMQQDFTPERYRGKSVVIQTADRPDDLGWTDYLSDSVRVIRVDCSGSELMRMPHVAELATRIKRELGLE